jgi:hypothetical protein
MTLQNDIKAPIIVDEGDEANGKGVFDWSVVGFLAVLIGIAVVVGWLLA